MELKSCRSCSSGKLEQVLDLGQVHINAFPLPGEPSTPKLPISLVFCTECSLVQAGHDHDPDLFFKTGSYPYRSSLTHTMRAALQDIADCARERVFLRRGDVVVDIGANDGTGLAAYPETLEKFGFEPATNLVQEARDANPGAVVVNDYFSKKAFESVTGRKAKLVQAIACFYDISKVNDFLVDVQSILARDGVFVVQMTGLRHTLENNDLGNLTHEHCCFYSLTALLPLLEKNGLYPFDYQENGVNGGSIRIWASPTRLPRSESLQRARWDERFRDYAHINPYLDFAARCADIKVKVRSFLEFEKEPYGLGASTKANLLWDYWGIDRTSLRGVAERDERKWGRECVSGRIPIVSEQEARNKASSFLAPIGLAFRGEILTREREAGFKGKICIPMPQFEVIE